jgi:hypothetical protein
MAGGGGVGAGMFVMVNGAAISNLVVSVDNAVYNGNTGGMNMWAPFCCGASLQ